MNKNDTEIRITSSRTFIIKRNETAKFELFHVCGVYSIRPIVLCSGWCFLTHQICILPFQLTKTTIVFQSNNNLARHRIN